MTSTKTTTKNPEAKAESIEYSSKYPIISSQLEKTLNDIFIESRKRRHEFLTVEHLLFALLDDPTSKDALLACSVNLDELKETLQNPAPGMA